MKRMTKRALALLAAATTAGALAACGQSSGDGDLTQVTYQPNFAYNGTDAYIFYGIDQGYFADEGIELDLVPGRTAQAVVDSVVAGDVTIGRTAGTNVILSAGQGQKVTSVGSVVQKSTFGFVVPEAEESAGFDGLSGMDVLTVAGGPNNSIAPIVLDQQGVDPDSVSLVNVNPAALLTTYGGGQGDAVLTSVPFAQPVVGADRPSGGLLFADAGVNVPDYSYVVQPEYLEEERDTVAAFLRAAYKSFDEAVANPEDAVAALADAVPTVQANEAAEQQLLGWEEFRCNEPGDAGPEDLAQWEDAVATFREAGLLKSDIDPATLFTNELFEDGSVEAGTC